LQTDPKAIWKHYKSKLNFKVRCCDSFHGFF